MGNLFSKHNFLFNKYNSTSLNNVNDILLSTTNSSVCLIDNDNENEID